ncbi:hypothetical protein FOZ62_013069, partial [Perkinsus olseni]
LEEKIESQIQARLESCEKVTFLMQWWSAENQDKKLLIITVRDVITGDTFPWRGRVLRGCSESSAAEFFEEVCVDCVSKCPDKLTSIVTDGRATSVNIRKVVSSSLATRVFEKNPGPREPPPIENQSHCLELNCFHYHLCQLLIGLLRCDSANWGEDGLFAEFTVLFHRLKVFLRGLEATHFPELKLKLCGIQLPELDCADPASAIEGFRAMLSQWKAVQRLASDIRLDYLKGLEPEMQEQFSTIVKLLEDDDLKLRLEIAIKLLQPLAELISKIDGMVLMECVHKASSLLDKLADEIEDAACSGAVEGISDSSPEQAAAIVRKGKEELIGAHQLSACFLPEDWRPDSQWQTAQIFRVNELLEAHGELLGLGSAMTGEVSSEVIDYFRARGEHKVLPRANITPSAYWELYKDKNILTCYLFKAATAIPSLASGDRLLADIKERWDHGMTDETLVRTLHAQWTLQERRRQAGKQVVEPPYRGSWAIQHEFGSAWHIREGNAPGDSLTDASATRLTGPRGSTEISIAVADDRTTSDSQKDAAQIAGSINSTIPGTPGMVEERGSSSTACVESLAAASAEGAAYDKSTSADRNRLSKGITHRFLELFREIECTHMCDGKCYQGCLMLNDRKRSSSSEYHILYDEAGKSGRRLVSKSMTISALKALYRGGKLEIPIMPDYVAELAHDGKQ